MSLLMDSRPATPLYYQKQAIEKTAALQFLFFFPSQMVV